IYLSAELRQYSLLLFFCAASLYLLDRAIAENLAGAMLLSLFCLYLALLTHYSSLIFALVLGLYALLRLRSTRVRGTIYAIWGLGGVYPYGGTRHNSYLAAFAVPGIAVALARWRSPKIWMTPLAITLALAICNLVVVPAGAYIRPKNQRRQLMMQAMDWMHRSL